MILCMMSVLCFAKKPKAIFAEADNINSYAQREEKMSSALQIGGLVSGLDTNAIIDALVDVERNKIRLVEAKMYKDEYRLSAYGTLASKLNAFETVAKKISDEDEFDLFTGTSSDEDYATIDGETSAVEGTYTIVVSQRAQAEKLSSLAGRVTDDSASLLGAGTASITVDGVTINLDSGDTIRDLAYMINHATNGSGESIDVKASVIKAADNDYRLVLTSTEEGLDNAIALTDATGSVLQDLGIIADAAGDKGNQAQVYTYTPAAAIPASGAMGSTGTFSFTGTDHNNNAVSGSYTLDGSTTENFLAYIETQFNQTVDASIDAGGNLLITDKTTGVSSMSITVTEDGDLDGDGTLGVFNAAVLTTTGNTGDSSIQVAADGFFTVDGIAVQTDSNEADGVVTGTTFNLRQADPTKEIILTLERDYDEIKGLVQEFVDGYNEVRTYIDENSKYAISSDDEDDAGMDGAFASDWTVNRVKSGLRSILTTQFTEWESSSAYNALSRIGVTSDARSGNLKIDDDDFKDAFDNHFEDMLRLFVPDATSDNSNVVFGRSTATTENGIYDLERIDDTYYRIRKQGDAAWTTSEARNGDVITFMNDAAKGLSFTIPIGNTDPAVVRYTKGIGQMMIDELDTINDSMDGYLTLSTTNLSSRIESMEDRINELEGELEEYRVRLTKRFSDLEQAMSQMQMQSASLVASIGSFG